jgi:hypothetical protein
MARNGRSPRWPGLEGAYLRFPGQVHVEQYWQGRLVEEFIDDAIWELMYLGHAR